eukprot:1158974-Pelagomonas_calceolata.AAC.10
MVLKAWDRSSCDRPGKWKHAGSLLVPFLVAVVASGLSTSVLAQLAGARICALGILRNRSDEAQGNSVMALLGRVSGGARVQGCSCPAHSKKDQSWPRVKHVMALQSNKACCSSQAPWGSCSRSPPTCT